MGAAAAAGCAGAGDAGRGAGCGYNRRSFCHCCCCCYCRYCRKADGAADRSEPVCTLYTGGRRGASGGGC